ncbi:hypothetical protein Taro_026644 [Colocasia esculenta]|uniref:Secreted protein n=1 Tax=Colocasia esculenta TaxID=4460 RepID=A0A843VFS9_COLES|nr:hypothetical protein [Colocasia esculenta]
MASRCPSLHGGCSLAVSSSVGLASLASWVVLSGCRVLTPDCCFYNPFLGSIRGGTGQEANLMLQTPVRFC